MHRSVLITLLFGVFALSGCGSKKEAELEKENKAALFKSGKPNDLDLSYIPEDAILAAVVNPQRMAKSPLFSNLDEQELAAIMGADGGYDFRQVEQVLVIVGMPGGDLNRDGNSANAIMRYATAQDPAELASQMFGSTEQRDVEGLTAYAPLRGKGGMVAVNEKTVLVGSPTHLSRMLKAKDATGPLVEKLRTVPTDNDVVAVFAMNEGLRMIANAGIGGAVQDKDFPAELKDAVEIPDNLESVTVVVDLSNQPFLRLAVDMKDEASAATLQKLSGKALELLKFQMGVDFDRLMRNTPDVFAAKTKRISEQLIDSVKITQESNQVFATADMPDEVDDSMARAVLAARNAAQTMKRKNDLKQIGLGLLNYHDSQITFPPSAGYKDAFDKDGKPYLSWRVHILPYIEQNALYEQFHLNEPWDSEHNKALLPFIPELYMVASGKKGAPRDKTLTTKLMVTGKGLAYEGRAGLRIPSFIDGTSNTVIVVEAGPDKAVPWTKPDDISIDPADPIASLGQTDDEGILALRVDGSVLTIPKEINAKELWALFTRDALDN